jgi:uncharacterized protein YqhQ
MGDELTINGKSFSYGGQAVIEGVLMRGAHTAAVACRNPKGQIVIHETPAQPTVVSRLDHQNPISCVG